MVLLTGPGADRTPLRAAPRAVLFPSLRRTLTAGGAGTTAQHQSSTQGKGAIREDAMGHRHILWFEEVGLGDIDQVGGKNASLGEMTRALKTAGVRVPDGFATTAAAYRSFLSANGLEPRLEALLEEFRAGRAGLQATGSALRNLVLASTLPDALAGALRQAYRTLAARAGLDGPAVAVRSSATAEDLPDASFAGQQETYLNITGEEDLLRACLRCYASLFTDRAISYRQAQGFGHLDVALSVGVQRMVRSDLGASGVMFSIDPDTGFPGAVVISAAWGLGETVVKGSVDPDRYTVFKPLLARPGAVPIIGAATGGKERKMVLAGDGSTLTVDTSPEERRARVLDEPEVIHLARWALAVEEHYGRPMDLEWARDGATGELFMVQARPGPRPSRPGAAGTGSPSTTSPARGPCCSPAVRWGNRSPSVGPAWSAARPTWPASATAPSWSPR
ncbi:hypothetical protein NCCP1664_19460 [Zafaria cholistanensis]|uniref:Phosphoenolpyruvate synthase n=1 Tax=Zafaria cholistanensis TaxID=1682741 RepID=A0A5A7NRL3_9MICC|nr:hypothetical protein NCCP1664_19460 [Zafaria cholistanensis]